MSLVVNVVEGSPEEAQRKLQYLTVKLWRDQYEAKWFIRDVRSDVYLRNEIAAFWEGRIGELHGWTDIVGQIVNAVVTPIRDALNWLWTNVMKPSIDAALAGLGWIAERARDLILSGLRAVMEAGGWLWQRFVDLTKPIVDTLSGVWNWIVEKASGALEAITKGLAAIPEAIASAFQSAISWIANVMADVGKRVVDFFTWIGKEVYNAVMGALKWVWDLISSAAQSFWNSLLALAKTVHDAIRGRGPEQAWLIIPVAIGAGAGIAALTDIVSVKVLGSGLHMRNLGDFMNRLISPETVGAALLGVLVGTSVRTPLTHVFNAWLRPNVPDISEATRMYWRGILTEQDLRAVIAYHGFGGKYEEGFVELTRVIPGINDLITFAVREAYPVEGPEAQYKEMVKWAQKQGLSPWWAERYWIAHWRLPDFGSYREAFWRGIISEEQFRNAILRLDYNPKPWRSGEKSDQEIMFELSYMLPSRLEQRWMLRWGLLDKAALMDLVRKSGVHPAWVEAVTEAFYRQMLTEERTRLLNEWRILYREGLVTVDEFTAKLKELYYSPDEIRLIVEAADKERDRVQRAESVVKYREATRADYSRAFKLGLIDEKQYEAALLKLGYNPDIVDDLIAIDKELIKIEQDREKQRLEEELRRSVKHATRTDLGRAFRLGVINEDVYRSRLKNLGYTDDEIDVIVSIDKELVQLERERQEMRKRERLAVEAARLTADEKNSVKTALVSLYVNGMLPETALRERLLQLGFSEDEVAFTVEAATLRFNMALLDKRIDAAVAEYRYGKITLEQLSQKLSELGLSSAFVQNIVLYESARTKTPVQSTPEEEVRAYGAAVAISRYVDGLITPVELEQELMLLGYGAAEIARYKVYADLKRDYEVFKEVLSAVRTAYRKGKITDMQFLNTLRDVGVPEATRHQLLYIEKLRLGYGVEVE